MGEAPRTWWRQTTPVGDLVVVLGARGVVGIRLPAPPGSDPIDGPPRREARCAAEIDEYFAGTRRTFSVAVDLGTLDGFRRRVLETLAREVPWGETVTYGELADMAGAPRAARAVGTAMARNPVPILIPCHRVVAAHGIGGYGLGGASMKQALLEIEGSACADPRHAGTGAHGSVSAASGGPTARRRVDGVRGGPRGW